MTRDKLTEMLSETLHVPMAEAGVALEKSGGNVRYAAKLLLQAQTRSKKTEIAPDRRKTGWKVGSAIRDLIARLRGNGLSPRAVSST